MQRTRAEEERARLLARVQTAHAEARGAERRAAFLADASSALSASLEYPAILESVAHLAVPYLADWCTVDVRGEDGSVERAVAHADPAKAELLRSLVRRYPPPASHPLRQAVRAGRALLLPVVTRDDEVVGVAQEDEHRDLARRLEIRSFMLIPLVARGRTLGAIALGSATPGRYGPADLSLGEDLARRAALAIDNARLYHDAQEAARRKDEFLAMLGHELRNPLAAIRGATQVLDRISSQIEPAVRQRAIIDRQTRHLARLVDDLLDVSRVVSGKIALQLEAVELNELALRCMQALQQRVEAQGPEMRFTAADAPVVVRGDPVRLEQVVSNLLDNAVKYTPADGRIELSVERVDGEAVVRVRDSGVGIAPELLPRVFDLFTQAERSLDRAQGGLGLGLTLVRRLVEQHGGSVAATSAGAGRGSEFLVSLPVLHERGDGAPAAEVQSAAPAGARHVLLIDDNADAREALRALLELWGHRVDVADDGPSGIELGRRLRPEVALVDIGLPGVDGYQVAAALRASEETRIQLVAITGYGQPEDRLRALEAGFDAHLVKPVDLDELARVLARPTATEAPGASRKLVSAGS
jgi:signal transduction histidine kinase/ActR/RegA family two-component response regulator